MWQVHWPMFPQITLVRDRLPDALAIDLLFDRG